MQPFGLWLRLTGRILKKRDMRKAVLAVMMALMVGSTTLAAVPHYRHNPHLINQQTQVDKGGVAAYSDTTATADDTASVADDDDSAGDDQWQGSDFDNINDPFKLMAYLTTLGVGGVFVAIAFVLVVLLICLAPFGLLVVLLVFLAKRRKQARGAVDASAGADSQQMPRAAYKPTDEIEELWQSGIKKAALGLGLTVAGICNAGSLFYIVGAILLCYGAGQALLARYSAAGKRTKQTDEPWNDDTFTPFAEEEEAEQAEQKAADDTSADGQDKDDTSVTK